MLDRTSKVEQAGQTRIAVVSARARVGDRIDVVGTGWADCPVELAIQGKPITPWKLIQGFPVGRLFRPDADGAFIVQVATFDLAPGQLQLSATQSAHVDSKAAIVEVELLPRPTSQSSVEDQDQDQDQQDEDEDESADGPYLRAQAFLTQRFALAGFIPPGTRAQQIRSVRDLRDINKLPPLGGFPLLRVANWTPIGTGPLVHDSGVANAGRTLCCAFDPTDPETMYIGTACGGVWKTTDGGRSWHPKSDFQISLAIGAIAIDPNDRQRIIAGTGEYNDTGGGTYYGNGVLSSIDGGESWTEVTGGDFDKNEISKILFDPTDATSQTLFLASDKGVYQSTDGGANWADGLMPSYSVGGLVLTQSSGDVQLVAAAKGQGIFLVTRTSGTWSWTQVTSNAFPAAFDRIALGQSANNPDTIYALFAEKGTDGFAGLARSDDGGSTWKTITVQLGRTFKRTSTPAGTDNHTHQVSVPKADLIAAAAARVYTTTAAGTPAHTHTVSFTKAEFKSVAGGATVAKTTDPDTTGHSHDFAFCAAAQSWYNLVVAVHPDDPDTVYLGDVHLWKTSAGGGVFSEVTSLHTDNHGFAFDPNNPDDIIWSLNDGGVYRSPDGGDTWEHRNTGLATLEYRSVAQHPQYDAVVIGGTQDNGTHRYEGNPAWSQIGTNDGGFTAIDQTTPTTMYHETTKAEFSRSDDAGENFTRKNAGITGKAEFKAPFALDPSDQDVCYFGGDALWRSDDRADSWAAITNTLSANICALAVHPSDPDTIYIGTTKGSIYRVQRTGANWNLANVTTTDLTGASLPAKASIGAIAVAADGTVWVTTASVLWSEHNGEFSNDHVYRRVPGGTTWESRSSGLATGNPINAIAIDPSNESRLFCGGDVGVFRTDDAGGTWTPWDDGLPNAPVFDLAVHGVSRLLRAATFGRSMWERPIDDTSIPLVDVYMRDNVIDTGRASPSLNGVPDPFDPSILVHHWQSPDIKVDAQEGSPPVFQTDTVVDNYVDFAVRVEHRNPQRGVTNRVYVQVLSRGVNAATNVKVRCFFAESHAGLPPLPADFWTSGRPFSGTPSGPDWTPVGPSYTFPTLAPGQPGIAEWNFKVPSSASEHSCLLAVATSDEDPLDAGGVLDIPSLVTTEKLVTLKNLHVVDAPPGVPMARAFQLLARGPLDGAASTLQFHWGSLPPETRLHVAFEAVGESGPIDPSEVARRGIEVGHPRHGVLPDHRTDRCGHWRRIDLAQALTLVRKGDATSVEIPEVRLPGDRSLAIMMNLVLPAHTADRAPLQPLRFDVIHRVGPRVIGGSTYQVRIKR